MNANKQFAPDVERLTTLIKNASPLIDNHTTQNYLRILMYAMIRGDDQETLRNLGLDLDVDKAEIIRRHRTHVLSLGYQLGMSLLAQLLCHEQTVVWRTSGETEKFKQMRRAAGPTSPAEESEVFAGVTAATAVDSFDDMIDVVRSGKCHSAVIVGCSTIGSRTFTDHCLRELREAMPVHGRIFIIG